MKNIVLVWAILCDKAGKSVGFVVTKGVDVFYVLKEDTGYCVYNTKHIKVCVSQTWQRVLKSLFQDCSLIYFKCGCGTALSGIDISVTGGTYTALPKINMYYKGTVPILDSISLVNIRAYVITRVSNRDYVVLKIIPDNTTVYKVVAEIQSIVDIAEDRRGKYINIVFRHNVLEFRQKFKGNNGFGNGFIPLELMCKLQLFDKVMDSDAGIQSAVASPESVVMQRNKILYDKLKNLSGNSYYVSQFTKKCIVDKANGKIVDRHLEARLRMLTYYGQFGKNRAAVAVMDVLLGTPSQFGETVLKCGQNWSKAIQDSLNLAVGFSPETKEEGNRQVQVSYTLLFYKVCFKYLLALYNGLTGEQGESGVFKHYILGYLCSADVMAVFLNGFDNKAVLTERKSKLKGIVAAFVDNLKIDCVSTYGQLCFKTLFEGNQVNRKRNTPFAECETVQQVIDILVDRLYTNLVELKQKYCTEVLITFAKVSKLYGVNEVSGIEKAMKTGYKDDLVLFEVCKYLRYQFLNPKIPTVAKMPYLQPLYVNKLNKELIMPVYSITRSYVVACSGIRAMRYVSEEQGKNKWLHIMPANVFLPTSDGKTVYALPNIHTVYSPQSMYVSNLLKSTELLKRVALEHKDNKAFGYLLLFVNYAYNKFDVM